MTVSSPIAPISLAILVVDPSRDRVVEQTCPRSDCLVQPMGHSLKLGFPHSIPGSFPR